MSENPRTPDEAIAWALGQLNGPDIWHGLCDHFVAQAYGWGNSGFGSAAEQWLAEPVKYQDMNPPAGALVFWSTGSLGHVALSMGDGTVLSTDILVPGGISRVSIPTINQKWGARYLGWAPPDFRGKAGGRADGVDTSMPLQDGTITSVTNVDGFPTGGTPSPVGALAGILNPHLWLRIGVGLIGALIVFVGFLVYTHGSVESAVSTIA